MTAIDIPVELAQIACEICLKEVPLSEAENPEAEDYVAHFWGLACFENMEAAGRKSIGSRHIIRRMSRYFRLGWQGVIKLNIGQAKRVFLCVKFLFPRRRLCLLAT